MSSVEARELTTPVPVPARYPWILLGLLWLVAFLNSADRTIVIAVMPQLRSEFGLSATQLALISSTFFWVYAVAAFLSGRLGDRVSRSKVILYGLAFWSVATGVASFASGVMMLIVLRGVVALGESTYFPTATALISDWHEPRMRSRTLSLHQTAVFAGAGLGALTSGLIADRMGWRVPFLIYGAAGLALCVVIRKWVRDAPPKHVAPTNVARPAGQEPLRIVLSSAPALFLCVVFLLATAASTGLTVWAPTYIHDVIRLNLGGSALYGSATINSAGFISVPLGGLLADYLSRRSIIGRFHALTIGLTLAAFLLLPLTLAGSALTVGIVLLTSSIGKGLFDGCIYAAMHDVVPPEARATAVGMMTMMGFFGAGITPIFVAQAAERYGMAMGITSLTVLYFMAIAILLLTRGITRRAVLETRQRETGT
jgi:MFS family permease